MQGVTLYIDVMKPLLKRLGNDYETFGRLVSICLEDTENDTISEKLENEKEDMLYDAFRICLNKGFEKTSISKNNGSKGGRPTKEISDNKKELNRLASMYVYGDKEKAKELLLEIIEKLGYDPRNKNDEGTKRILEYFGNEINKLTL